MRASRRPKNSSMNRRATCVESTRSVGEWKLPTFSAREWRSAAADALGANGSCTCTRSSGATSSRRSIARLASSGSDTRPPRRAGATQRLHRREHPHLARLRTATRDRGRPTRISRRDSRTWAREPLARQHQHAVPALREPVGERARRTRSPRAAPPTDRGSPARSRAASRRRSHGGMLRARLVGRTGRTAD